MERVIGVEPTTFLASMEGEKGASQRKLAFRWISPVCTLECEHPREKMSFPI